jgi:hypothetical protein
MTWAFSLSAECGSNQSAAYKFAEHFDGLPLVLDTGLKSKCHTAIFQDFEDHWWCQVCPDNISGTGVDALDIAYTMTEMGFLLYQRLKLSPLFRYALVGIEVDEFRTYSELRKDILTTHFPGLVLAENTWRDLKSPTLFEPFSPGYLWHPYEGEAYKPLTVSPDLQNKLNRLRVRV